MSYPLVFIHEGNQEYLKFAIKSAVDQNHEVFLLGNDLNKTFCENWISIDTFNILKFDKFKEVYEHMSSNNEIFELLCFKRYFILLEFMEKSKLDEVIMLDSDVLVYTDFSDYNLKNYSVALSIHENQDNYRWSCSPHCSYWTISALRDFINFCIMTYSNNKKVLHRKYIYHKKNNIKGGICDMTLLYLWSKDKSNVLNLSQRYNFGTIDKTISSSENYYKNEYKTWKLLKLKKIKYNNEMGYYITSRSGEKVKAHIIHCQGAAKNLIEAIYNKNILKVKLKRIEYLIKKVINLC